MVDTVELIKQTIETDLFGGQHAIDSKRKCYCEVKSISQTEFYRAKESKIGVKYCLKLNTFDYQNETHAVYKGTKYTIIRTYTNGDYIEIYIGDNNGTK